MKRTNLKRMTAVMLALAMIFCMTACREKEQEPEKEREVVTMSPVRHEKNGKKPVKKSGTEEDTVQKENDGEKTGKESTGSTPQQGKAQNTQGGNNSGTGNKNPASLLFPTRKKRLSKTTLPNRHTP